MLVYEVVPRKNPITKESLFYAQLAPVVPAGLDEVALAISNECTITVHDIRGVISALEEQVYTALRDGRSVHLGQLGCFIPTLRSRPTLTAEEFAPANIQQLNCTFRPSPRLRYEMSVDNHSVKFKCNKKPAAAEPGAGA